MLTRDQVRAQHAYACVKAAKDDGCLEDYKILVNSLGANVMRSGLAAAIAFLEREKRKEVTLFLNHLAAAKIPGLDGTNAQTLPAKVRALQLQDYMLATRELLRVVLWFRRAVQAAGAAEPAQAAGGDRAR